MLVCVWKSPLCVCFFSMCGNVRMTVSLEHLFVCLCALVHDRLCVCVCVWERESECVWIHATTHTVLIHSPGWCAANTAACACAWGEGWPGDRRCVHLPRSARLRPPPYTTAQTGLKNAGSPSVESVWVTTGRRTGLGDWHRLVKT